MMRKIEWTASSHRVLRIIVWIFLFLVTAFNSFSESVDMKETLSRGGSDSAI